MKRRVSWAFLACTMAIAPLALVGCGDDDDNPTNPAGAGGSAGTAGKAGTAGTAGGNPAGASGASGASGTAGGAACIATEGLTRTVGQACADSQLVCKQTFTFPDEAGIREVQLQGALIPDTSWVTGAYMKKNGANWTAEMELPQGAKVPHRFYVLRDTDAWNFGTNVDQPELTVSCTTPVCATHQDPWAAEAKRARPAPPVPADPVVGQPAPPFDWRDSVMYFVFVDRFMNGDKTNDNPLIVPDDAPPGTKPGVNDYMGGDFEGVIQKINQNYFTDLGVNTLWVTVPFNNTDQLSPTAPPDQCDGVDEQYGVGCFPYTGYHGYWPLDQWPVAAAGVVRAEEHFGSELKLKAMVDAAHAKGIKIVFDYAMVHVYEDSKLYQSFLAKIRTNANESLGVDETWFTPKYAVDENGDYIVPVFAPDPSPEDPNRKKITAVQHIEYQDGGVTKNASYRDFPAPQLALEDGAVNPTQYLPPGVTVETFAANFFECNCNGDTRQSICNWDGFVDKANDIILPTIGERCWFQGYLPHLNYKDQLPRSLPDDSPVRTSARDYSLKAAVLLAKDMVADGYRLDAVKHIDQAWYTEVRTRLNAEVMPSRPAGERFYLVGETYDFNGRYNLDRFIDPATRLDGQFDFPFRAQLGRAVLASKGSPGGAGAWKDSMKTFVNFMHSNDNYYGGDAVMSTWVGNHDVGRPIHIAEDSVTYWDEYSDGKARAWTNQPTQPTAIEPYERLANAYAVMMTNPGAPLIYYGDEYGLAGAGDPDNRRPLFDDAGAYAANPSQTFLYERVKKLTAIRKAHKALRYGTRTTVNVSDNVWIYKMTLNDAAGAVVDEVIVALNRSDLEVTSCGDVPVGTYTNLINDTMVPGDSLKIPPRQTLILAKRLEPRADPGSAR